MLSKSPLFTKVINSYNYLENIFQNSSFTSNRCCILRDIFQIQYKAAVLIVASYILVVKKEIEH